VVQPHHTFVDHPKLDIVVIPGGQGTRRERLDRDCVDWIASQDRVVELTTSVCTGAFLLAEAGLLSGGAATTHWTAVDWMRNQYPDVDVRADARVVDRGHVITSAGISAGIDMALHVVYRLHGRETAQWTARRMEYEWVRAEPATPAAR
jgi:transcriptional regulator GlxA family with amidase domain